jgi:hypothetical protein
LHRRLLAEMPPDYQSTAHLPSNPEVTPNGLESPPNGVESPLFLGARPPWTQSNISGSRISPPLSTPDAVSIRSIAIYLRETLWNQPLQRWQKLTLWQKALAVFAVALAGGLLAGMWALAGKFFGWIRPMAEKWEAEPGAYIIVWFCVILVSFPPLIGWATLGTISGLIFGLGKGYVFTPGYDELPGRFCTICLTTFFLLVFLSFGLPPSSGRRVR